MPRRGTPKKKLNRKTSVPTPAELRHLSKATRPPGWTLLRWFAIRGTVTAQEYADIAGLDRAHLGGLHERFGLPLTHSGKHRPIDLCAVIRQFHELLVKYSVPINTWDEHDYVRVQVEKLKLRKQEIELRRREGELIEREEIDACLQPLAEELKSLAAEIGESYGEQAEATVMDRLSRIRRLWARATARRDDLAGKTA